MASVRLLGYISTLGGPSDLDADAQERELRRAAESMDLKYAEVVREQPDATDTLQRQALQRVLKAIVDGQAAGVVVAELERLTLSLVDLGDLLAWLRDAGARFVALDLGIDTATPDGRKVAAVLIALGEQQRWVVSRKTKAGMAAARARGKQTGRPAIPDEVAERIRAWRAERPPRSLRWIANQLNAEGVPTARGAPRWHASAVQRAAGYQRPRRRRRPELPPLDDSDA